MILCRIAAYNVRLCRQGLHRELVDGRHLGLTCGTSGVLNKFLHTSDTTCAKKHYDMKWRKLRGEKVMKMDLPDYDKVRREANMTPDEMRAEMKKRGVAPPRVHQDRSIIISSTNTVFEAYVPPEGDGSASLISGQGAKQRVTELEKKGKSYMQVRKIRQFDEDFDTKQFAEQALEIYVEAHHLLMNVKRNEDRLHELVTERAYPDMTWKMDVRTVRWRYVEALEPPRVVHVRTTEMISKENVYAQVTVRFHTKQILAVYDRFGRLMYGSESLVKDCLEYVVFEKHLADEYGQWRIHGKITPDWLTSSASTILRTMRRPEFKEEDATSKPSPTSQEPEGSGTVDNKPEILLIHSKQLLRLV